MPLTPPLTPENAAANANAGAGAAGDIKQQKQALRRRILQQRAALGAAARASESAQICRRLLQLPEFQRARCIAAFAPMGEEVDLWSVLDDCVARQKTVALPRVADAAARALSFHAYRRRADLQSGYRGIEEPAPDAKNIPVYLFDFIIIPAVAIDRRKKRLGYGGGFYDKVLFEAPQATSCATIFRCQRVEFLPSEPHDRPVKLFISP